MEKITRKISGHDVSVYLRDVSPMLASSILAEHNTKNRKILPSHVTALAKNMKEGTWRFNGDSIRFDSNGTLIDGQHRLMAIVKSGCTIPCIFVVGLDPDTIKCIDIEMKPRNLKNLFEFDFVKCPGVKATTIRRYFALRDGYVTLRGGSGGLMNGTLVTETIETKYNFYYENEDVINQVISLAHSLNKKTQLLPLADISSIALLLIHDLCHSYDMVNDFFEGIMMGSEIPMLNDIHCTLAKDITSKRRMTGQYKQSLIAKCWNYYSQGKFVKYVKYSPERDGKIQFQ